MSPYREAPAATPIMVACAACGEAARVAEADAHFRCARCQLDQGVSRDDELAAPPMVVVEVNDGKIPYDELRAFARTVGVDRHCKKIALLCAGIRCAVGLDIDADSDATTGSYASARAAGLPAVTFRRESKEEVRAKAAGITREVQTGDEAFDREVFVDSEAADRDLLTMLSSPAVRRAIRVLVADFESVVVDPTGIVAERNVDKETAYDPARLHRWLAAVRVVAGAPRPLTSTKVEVPRSYTRAWRLAALSLLGFPLFIAATVGFTPVSGLTMLVFGAPGLLLALASRPLLVRSLSGRAQSHTVLAISWFAMIFGLPWLTIAIGLFVNGAFDRSPERVRELRITETGEGEGDGETHVHAAASDGSGFTEEFDFHDRGRRVRVGQPVFMRTKRGALGFEWSLRKATVKLPDGTQIVE